MEKVIPSFQYELLVLTPKLETLDEEKESGHTNGVRPSKIRIEGEEPTYVKGGRDSSQRETGGAKYALKYTL
jgi:hypothetical protein